MPGHFDITNLAIVAVAALGCGILLTRLRQPAIVGYILAGILLGPSGLGLVESREQVSVLAEVGVLLLLFMIGLELDISAFRSVLRVAVTAVLAQIALGVGAAGLVGNFLHWPLPVVILMGCAVALSSTAVAIKILEDSEELDTQAGRLAVGVLIAQDLAVVPILLIVNAMGGAEGAAVKGIVLTAFSTVFLVLFIAFLARRERMVLPFARSVEGNADLSALAAVGLCFAGAAVTGLIGLSAAYGAFLAGLFIGNTDHREAVHKNALPIQSLTLMVFFLSIGLLIDLAFIWEHILSLVGLLVLVTFGKTAINIGILHILKQPWRRSFTVGAVIGQVGEFSFVLAAAGVAQGIIGETLNQYMVALIALSLMSSPLWQVVANRLHDVVGQPLTLVQTVAQLTGRAATRSVEQGQTLLRTGRKAWDAVAGNDSVSPNSRSDGNTDA